MLLMWVVFRLCLAIVCMHPCCVLLMFGLIWAVSATLVLLIWAVWLMCLAMVWLILVVCVCVCVLGGGRGALVCQGLCSYGLCVGCDLSLCVFICAVSGSCCGKSWLCLGCLWIILCIIWAVFATMMWFILVVCVCVFVFVWCLLAHDVAHVGCVWAVSGPCLYSSGLCVCCALPILWFIWAASGS